MDRQPYSYAVLRYRHDPLAGELINLGVLLHAPKSSFLKAALRNTYGRLSKLYPNLEGAALTGDCKRIETAVRRFEREGEDLFSSSLDAGSYGRRIIDDPAGSYIWGKVGFGVTDDPQRTLDKLFQRFVGRFEVSAETRRSDADVWRPARDLLAEKHLADLLQPKTIRSSRDEVEFSHAWKNGLWHCLQPLSFDLADSEGIKQKVARWVGHMVGLSSAEEEFQPYFIVGKPSQEQLMPAYERAVAFLAEAPTTNPPRVVEEDGLPELVEELEHQMANHVAS